MRVWLDPDKLASKDLTAVDVINAVKEQNRQVAAGRLGQSPVPTASPIQFQLPINTKGRLTTVDQFENIVLKTSDKGGVVHFKDIVRDALHDKEGQEIEKGVELGAKNYDVNSYLDGDPAITLAVFQLPGSNAVETADAIRTRMEEMKQDFPKGVDYRLVYDTTVFIDESVKSVFHTLFEAIILVFIVVLVFLQNWRTTLIPMIAVPVSLVGTFAVMALLGFSLNNLSLFGLVLAIGIVVDDAIVVVENVERHLALGKGPRDAARAAMTETVGPVIAIALVLIAVFVPTAFMAGISGQFYKQFALTIAASTVISAFNSLTLSPALCVLLLKPHGHGDHEHSQREALPRLGIVLIAGLVAMFVLPAYVAPLFGLPVPGHGGSAGEPSADVAKLWALRGALFVAGGAIGWFLATVINRLLGGMFVILTPFEERAGRPELSAEQVMARLRKTFRDIEEAQATVFGAPPIDGLGSTGGFKMQVQDRAGLGLEALQGTVANVTAKG